MRRFVCVGSKRETTLSKVSFVAAHNPTVNSRSSSSTAAMMSSTLRNCVCVVALLACVGSVQAVPRPLQWGPLGHSMTALIAQQYLTENSTNACKNLLPSVNGDISLIASWADDVARDLYPWSPQLHFINTPDWDCNYVQSRDCIGGDDGAPMACLDGAIQNYTGILVAAEVDANEMTDALMFLVHFIGDIHQPLHVGFSGDYGGNTEYGQFEDDSDVSLHHVWDTSMLMKRMLDDFNNDTDTYLQNFVTELSPGGIYNSLIPTWRKCTNPAEPNEACSIEWANGSVALACSTAYVDQDGNQIQNGFDLEDPYYQFALPVAEKQLAKGGVRLANVMNSIFASASTARYVVAPEVYKQQQAKIALA